MNESVDQLSDEEVFEQMLLKQVILIVERVESGRISPDQVLHLFALSHKHRFIAQWLYENLGPEWLQHFYVLAQLQQHYKTLQEGILLARRTAEDNAGRYGRQPDYGLVNALVLLSNQTAQQVTAFIEEASNCN